MCNASFKKCRKYGKNEYIAVKLLYFGAINVAILYVNLYLCPLFLPLNPHKQYYSNFYLSHITSKSVQ